MKRNLPPLNALRTFEAVARSSILSVAAKELMVTPSAVSQQIRVLEEFLGVDLFERISGRLLLTPSGQALMESVGRALDILQIESTKLQHVTLSGTMRIACAPAFMSKWLLQNIGRFLKKHPRLDIDLRVILPRTQSLPHDVDICIEYGLGNWPGRRCVELDPIELTPVCSPTLLNSSNKKLRTPMDLHYFRLIHDDTGETWRRWLAAAGAKTLPETGAIYLDNFVYAIDAAIAGLGVVLADQISVASSLENGLLVRPLDYSLPADGKYYLVYSDKKTNDPVIRSFVSWIKGEILNNKTD